MKKVTAIDVQMFAGRVLSADETQEEAESLVQRPAFESASVSFTLPEQDVNRLECTTAKKATRITMAPGPQGCMHVILSVQRDDWLLRILVPLIDASAHAWLREVSRRSAALLLVDIEGKPQLTAAVAGLPGVDQAKLEAFAQKSVVLRGHELADDIAAVAAACCRIESMKPNIAGVRVRWLRVVIAGADAIQTLMLHGSAAVDGASKMH